MCLPGSRRNSRVLCSSGMMEQQVLQDAVKRRASEQCMPLYLDTFVQRQIVRGRDTTTGGTSQRELLKQQANRFDVAYGQAQSAMEGRLSFQPPTRRRHSVQIGQVVRLMHADETRSCET